MADELLRYIKQQLDKGYSPSSVKSVLISQGYSPALIDGILSSIAIKQSPAPLENIGVSHERKLVPVIAILAILFAGAGIAAFLLFRPESLFDVTASADKTEFTPGEDMTFDLELTNTGTSDIVDVTLIYKIFDGHGNMILTSEETLAVEKQGEYSRKMRIPNSIKPGQYEFKAIARYDGKSASAGYSFQVEAAPVRYERCSDAIRNQDEVGPDCGGRCGGYWYDGTCNAKPAVTDGVDDEEDPADEPIDEPDVSIDDPIDDPIDEPIDPTEPITTPIYEDSYTTLLMQARNQASQNPDSAKATCDKISSQDGRDSCYKTVAGISKKSTYCDSIYGYEERDSCLLPFFLEGDFTVCSRLRLAENRGDCEQLRDIALTQAELEAATQQTAAE